MSIGIGSRVKNIYTGEIGTVLGVWDGKYLCSCYDSEQYNPHRITIQLDNSTEGSVGNGTIMQRLEYLEEINIS